MDLYYSVTSPPCRAIYMTAKALGIELNKKSLDLKGGEHLKPEFLKLNPQHTIPTLVDGDFAIWESRAIMVYLIEKYGKKDDALYPSCPRKRAVINQRLYFDMGTLYKSLSDYYYALRDKKSADPELYTKIEVAMDFLNTFLQNSQYVAGEVMTVADLSLLATVSTFEVINFDFSKYPNVARWYASIQNSAPGAEENKIGCVELKKMFESLKS